MRLLRLCKRFKSFWDASSQKLWLDEISAVAGLEIWRHIGRERSVREGEQTSSASLGEKKGACLQVQSGPRTVLDMAPMGQCWGWARTISCSGVGRRMRQWLRTRHGGARVCRRMVSIRISDPWPQRGHVRGVSNDVPGVPPGGIETVSSVAAGGWLSPVTSWTFVHFPIAVAGLVLLTCVATMHGFPLLGLVSLGLFAVAAAAGLRIFIAVHRRKQSLPVWMFLGHGAIAITALALLWTAVYRFDVILRASRTAPLRNFDARKADVRGTPANDADHRQR